MMKKTTADSMSRQKNTGIQANCIVNSCQRKVTGVIL